MERDGPGYGGSDDRVGQPVNEILLPGWFNARDLGGLRCASGRVLRPGALARSDAPDGLGVAGFRSLWELGYRTLIDLRNEDEVGEQPAEGAERFVRVSLPHDGEDVGFWLEWGTGPQFGTPLFYAPHLERFPGRTLRVLEAIAAAPPGGVVVHCSVGRDRTGMVLAVLLRLLGVGIEAIVRDYEASEGNLPRLYEARGVPSQSETIRRYLHERGLTPGQCVRDFLEGETPGGWRDRVGLGHRVLEALEARLTGP